MTLDELEELAEEFTYPCINEGVIKELIALCRIQHAALIESSPCMWNECKQVQTEMLDVAVAAFNKFGETE